jgi:hypothetical protein
MYQGPYLMMGIEMVPQTLITLDPDDEDIDDS